MYLFHKRNSELVEKVPSLKPQQKSPNWMFLSNKNRANAFRFLTQGTQFCGKTSNSPKIQAYMCVQQVELFSMTSSVESC